MPFRKYPTLHELESNPTQQRILQGVSLTESMTQDSGLHVFSICFSLLQFLTNGTTDAGNIEDELVVLLYCERDDDAGEVKSYARYFTVEVPKRADADIACLGHALKKLGVEDVLSKASVLGAEGKPMLL